MAIPWACKVKALGERTVDGAQLRRLQGTDLGPLPVALNKELQDLADANPGLMTFDAKSGMVKFDANLPFASGSAVVTPGAAAAHPP